MPPKKQKTNTKVTDDADRLDKPQQSTVAVYYKSLM